MFYYRLIKISVPKLSYFKLRSLPELLKFATLPPPEGHSCSYLMVYLLLSLTSHIFSNLLTFHLGRLCFFIFFWTALEICLKILETRKNMVFPRCLQLLIGVQKKNMSPLLFYDWKVYSQSFVNFFNFSFSPRTLAARDNT